MFPEDSNPKDPECQSYHGQNFNLQASSCAPFEIDNNPASELDCTEEMMEPENENLRK
jgi:hypothetical protein